LSSPSASGVRSESGSITLPRAKQAWVPTLRGIYEFESARISGPGSWKKDIRDVVWTIDDLARTLRLDEKTRKHNAEVIDWMVQNRHVMRIVVPGGEARYITRVG